MDAETVREARIIGRILLVIGGLAIVAPVVWWVISPITSHVMVDADQPGVLGAALGDVIIFGAFGAALLGLAWMWRIHRAPMRTDAPTWRYRDPSR